MKKKLTFSGAVICIENDIHKGPLNYVAQPAG